MKLKCIAEAIDAQVLCGQIDDTEVERAVCCDLLSWVVGNAVPDCAFITIQTNMNVVAVASLMDISCIIIVENANIEENVLAKAEEEGIPVLRTAKAAFDVCGLLFEKGVRACYKNETVC